MTCTRPGVYYSTWCKPLSAKRPGGVSLFCGAGSDIGENTDLHAPSTPSKLDELPATEHPETDFAKSLEPAHSRGETRIIDRAGHCTRAFGVEVRKNIGQIDDVDKGSAAYCSQRVASTVVLGRQRFRNFVYVHGFRFSLRDDHSASIWCRALYARTRRALSARGSVIWTTERGPRLRSSANVDRPIKVFRLHPQSIHFEAAEQPAVHPAQLNDVVGPDQQALRTGSLESSPVRPLRWTRPHRATKESPAGTMRRLHPAVAAAWLHLITRTGLNAPRGRSLSFTEKRHHGNHQRGGARLPQVGP